MDKRIIKIADTYGYDAQSRQLIEEMAELTQAVNKFWRKQLDCGKKKLADIQLDSKELGNILEEMADVKVMLAQMEYFFDCTQEVIALGDYKINRQLQFIDSMEVEK